MTIIYVLLAFAILYFVWQILSKKEGFFAETPNGILSQTSEYDVKTGPQSTYRYGEQQFTKHLQLDGQEGSTMQNLLQDFTAGANSTKRAEANISQQIKEQYTSMKQKNEEYDDEGINTADGGMMTMLENQANNIQIQRQIDIGNNDTINSLQLLKQVKVLKQMPLQDVNEIQRTNEDAQMIIDHKNLIASAYGSNMQVAPYNPNADVKARVKYTVNSNLPGRNLYSDPKVPIKEHIEFNHNFDLAKEARIKASGPNIPMPDISKIQKMSGTTRHTQEPIVQADQQKIVLDQTITTTPESNGQKVLVEQTVNPEIIAKVHNEMYQKWPMALITKEQKEGAAQFMTILVLLRAAKINIPDLKELAEQFPEIKKMKASRFSYFDKGIQEWAAQQIQLVRDGQLSIDSIINKFNQIYKTVDPIQKAQTGVLNPNGNIEKYSSYLQAPFGSGREGYTTSNGKMKFIQCRESYTITPQRSGKPIISRKSTKKIDFIV